jgi:hypothetical protein
VKRRRIGKEDMSTAGEAVDVPVELATERVKRVRTTVSHKKGVNWDDIELESDDDHYVPVKKGKTASKDAGQQRGNQAVRAVIRLQDGIPLANEVNIM